MNKLKDNKYNKGSKKKSRLEPLVLYSVSQKIGCTILLLHKHLPNKV